MSPQKDEGGGPVRSRREGPRVGRRSDGAEPPARPRAGGGVAFPPSPRPSALQPKPVEVQVITHHMQRYAVWFGGSMLASTVSPPPPSRVVSVFSAAPGQTRPCEAPRVPLECVSRRRHV